MQLILATVLALLVPDLGQKAAGPVADADAPTVGVSLDKSEAHVGDRLTLTVSAVGRRGVAVTLPAKLDLGKLDVLDRSSDEERDLGDGRVSHRFVLGVSAYDLGELDVPAVELTYINPRGEAHTVATQPVTLHVKPLVVEEDKPEVQPLRPTRSAWIEDKRVLRALRWGAVGLGGV